MEIRIEVDKVDIDVFFDGMTGEFEIEFNDNNNRLEIERLSKEELIHLKKEIESCLKQFGNRRGQNENKKTNRR